MLQQEKIDPYGQGLEAAMTGKSADTNPYHDSTSAWVDWRQGHDDGEDSWKELCAREVEEGRPHPGA